MSNVATTLAPARRIARRLTASFLAVALFMATGGAMPGGSQCAHHDAPAAADLGATGGSAHADHGAHAAHGAAAGDASSGHAHDESDACTCVGACQSATTLPAASEPPVVAGAALPTAIVAPELRLELLPRVWQAAWFLPPGNGPPALA